MVQIILVDDHPLLSNAIATLINQLPNYNVLHEVRNGKELQQLLLVKKNIPDIILLDINMPIMNGFETMKWLKNEHPTILVLALTMNNDDEAILKMLQLGVHGYLLKDTDTNELIEALDSVMKKGFFYTDFISARLVKSLSNNINKPIGIKEIELKETEKEFIRLAATELTYKEIAAKLNISPKTVEGMRETLFLKLNLKSRVGLVLHGIRERIVTV